MNCPVCGGNMYKCERNKVQETTSVGLLGTMFNMTPVRYQDKYKCELCDHITIDEVKDN